MSNITDQDSTPITSVTQLSSYLEEGCKPIQQWRIGTEHEKFGFSFKKGSESSYLPPPYQPGGIENILQNMLKNQPGWQGLYDQENLIGLDTGTGAAISLEPAGQLELSGAPLSNLHESYQEMKDHFQQVHQAADPLGIGFAPLGFHPFATRQQMPWMPKKRYEIMKAYMPRVGTMGLDMMQRTCTVQVNLDFSSEADMARKMRVSMALQPLTTALFANSPFYEGKPNGYLSIRSHIWTDTDNDRTGIPEHFFENSFGFEQYVEWLLDVPMYFVIRNGEMLDVAGASLRDWMNGSPPEGLEKDYPTMGDFKNHVTVAFPEVRLKHYLEMRGADAGRPDMMLAMSALWTGLFYDDATLIATEQFLKERPWKEYRALRWQVPRHGLSTIWGKSDLRLFARHIFSLASEGLKNRGIKNQNNQDECLYLEPLEAIIDGKPTQAEHWLEQYHGLWHGEVKHIFNEAKT